MTKISAYLLYVIIVLLAATSCQTVLNAGQLCKDSIVPPPFSPSRERMTATELLVSGAGTYNNSERIKDTESAAQIGILRAWRRTSEYGTFEGHLATSAWYGQARIDYDDNTIAGEGLKLPSAKDPFAYYGATIQAEEGIEIAPSSRASLGAGLRGSIAYEDGTFREFRKQAEKAAEIAAPDSIWQAVVDNNPSAWTGKVGIDLSTIFGHEESVLIRLGLFGGFVYTFSAQSMNPEDLEIQGSAEMKFHQMCFAAELSCTFEMLGAGLSLGYLLP